MAEVYSLHIGVEKYDTNFYTATANRLTGCLNDMEAMCALARSHGVAEENAKFIPNPTRRILLNELKGMQTKLSEGDIFFFTFSGHGWEKPDKDGDEIKNTSGRKGMDQTICLSDRPVLDDELNAIFRSYDKGVRIITLFDSCHSGSVHSFTLLSTDLHARSASGSRLSGNHRTTVSTEQRDTPPPVARGLTVDEVQAIYSRNLLFAVQSWVQSSLRSVGKIITSPDRRLSAVGISLAACEDDEKAYETTDRGKDNRGIFSLAFEMAIQELSGSPTYEEIFQRSRDLLSQADQHPTLSSFETTEGTDTLKNFHQRESFLVL